MWETQVRSLGGEDPLENEMAPTPAFLPGKFHGLRRLVGYSPWGCKESDVTERLHFLSLHIPLSVYVIFPYITTGKIINSIIPK